MLRVDREDEGNKFLRNVDDVLLLDYQPHIPEASNLHSHRYEYQQS
jgi:hypothetical protein